MSNDYFQFKKFRVAQSQCAMKVSTDACILGAWTPLTPAVQNVWDIGTGTGLLSLMTAQRLPDCNIDAIDIDIPATEQAFENVKHSPFANRIKVQHADALNWNESGKYDLIVCNPPFFTASLKGPDEQRNLARHTGSLNLESLAGLISKSLKEKGYASVLLPVSEQERWQQAATTYSLFCNRILLIKPFEHSAANRIIIICSKEQKELVEETLVIYKEPKIYTEDFTILMRPFYLNL